MSDAEVELLHKFQKIMRMASKVKKAEVAKALGLSEDDLFLKLMDWSDRFPFKVDGDIIVVDNTFGFMSALDQAFADWGTKEEHHVGKMDDSSPNSIIGEKERKIEPEVSQPKSNAGNNKTKSVPKVSRPKRENFNETIKKGFKLHEAVDYRGAALLRSGDAKGAIEALRKAVAIKPDYAVAWSSLGLALATSGDAKEATAAYRKALELDPQDEDAIKYIRRKDNPSDGVPSFIKKLKR